MQPHIDPAVLVDYALGRLSRHSAAEVRAHCLRCGACGDQLAAVIALRQHVRGTGDPGVDWTRVGAVAAAVLLAVGITAIGFQGDGSAARGAGTGVETVLDGSGTAANATPTSRALARDLADLDRRMGLLRMALGTEARVSEGYDRETQLRVALERLSARDLAGMAEALEPFAERYDPWGTPLLGIALYLDGDESPQTVDYLREASERAFREGVEPSNVYVERLAAWYLVRVERDLGRTQAAEELLASIAEFEDAFGPEARASLDRRASAR